MNGTIQIISTNLKIKQELIKLFDGFNKYLSYIHPDCESYLYPKLAKTGISLKNPLIITGITRFTNKKHFSIRKKDGQIEFKFFNFRCKEYELIHFQSNSKKHIEEGLIKLALIHLYLKGYERNVLESFGINLLPNT